jgi:hypothetical protein
LNRVYIRLFPLHSLLSCCALRSDTPKHRAHDGARRSIKPRHTGGPATHAKCRAPTNVALDTLWRVSLNLRDETSPLEAAAKPDGVLQAASSWSGYDLGEPARAVATVSPPVQLPRRQWPI